MSRWWCIFFLVSAFFVIDRVSKWLAWHVLPADGLFAVPGVVGLTLERNQGIAYSIPLPLVLLILVTGSIIILLFALLVRAYRRRELSVVFFYGLIIIGACSNLLDRLRYGYVIDMIVLTGWPVFNLSDVFIASGAAGLIGILLRSGLFDNKRQMV